VESEEWARGPDEIFESFGEARRQGFIQIKSLKEQGYGVAGIFCSRVPVELFMAAGLIPVSLCPAGGETANPADTNLPEDLCPLVRASYGAALAGTCPYIYFSDLVVGETSCDGKIRMYELLGKIKNVHVMELPRTGGESSRTLWLAEIRLLQKKIEEEFHHAIDREKLREAIRRRNRERSLVKEFYELSLAKPPPMTGLQQLRVLQGSRFRFNHKEKLRELGEAIGRIKGAYGGGKGAVPEGARRILVTGCPTGAMETTIGLIEESGAVGVVYENCTGARPCDRQVAETGDPYDALCDYYLGMGCAVGDPGRKRRELLGRLCAQFAVDGVIEINLRFCHAYLAETRGIGEFLRVLDLPFLSLELDYSTGDVGGLRDRIAGFIKTLRHGGKRTRKEGPCW
jgi:benzoyl-CoA reductase/2-hydroxyglutaryl-CoA dehydratase subunit BcrC/BadD/HgdB